MSARRLNTKRRLPVAEVDLRYPLRRLNGLSRNPAKEQVAQSARQLVATEVADQRGKGSVRGRRGSLGR